METNVSNNIIIKNFYEHGPKNGKPEQLIILLHGVGSNGQDLISLAPMWQPFVPQALFISPDAPFVCDMAPVGYPNSYQWFSLQNRDPQVLLQGLRDVFPIIERFIDQKLSECNLDYDCLALVGFSQGTMTSLYTAPRLLKKIAGVLAYSGALLSAGDEGAKQKPPIHMIHGEADDVVPVQAWHFAKEVLENDGFKVSGYTTPRLTHSIDIDGIQSGGEFLRKIFQIKI